MYAQNAILVNEFTGHSWSKVRQCIDQFFHGMFGREERIVLDSINEVKKQIKILIINTIQSCLNCLPNNMHSEFSACYEC